MDLLQDTDVRAGLLKLAAVLIVIVGAFVLNWVGRFVLRQTLRRAVRRALAGQGRWKVRLPRSHDGGSGEQRRLQRADAAAHMLSRVAGVILAFVAALVVSRGPRL